MDQLINFLGLGLESGQSHQGLALSPEYFRKNFLNNSEYKLNLFDHGDIYSSFENYHRISKDEDLECFNWKAFQQAYFKISSLLRSNNLLINWGGDHSMAIPTVGAFCKNYPSGKVLWIDAHADLNLPEHSPTGNLHGMPLALLMNLDRRCNEKMPWLTSKLKPEQLIYLGIRDLDPFEVKTIEDLGIKHYTAKDIRTCGIDSIAFEIVNEVKSNPLHISFDIDSLDPELAPSTGVPVTEGLKTNDLEYLSEILSAHSNIKSIDIAEINPLIGSEKDVYMTCLAAVKFLKSFVEKNKNKQGELYDKFSNPYIKYSTA